MKVRFCAPVFAASGYAEFARYFVYALHRAGVDIAVESINIEANKNLDYGKKGALCKKLTVKMKNPDINIINMLPMFFSKYKVKGAKNIGFTMWEADKLPQSWVDGCNQMDAIFVPCTWNKEVFKSSGVTVPVYVVSPGVDPSEVPQNVKEYQKNDIFTFYSIFQWSKRKNPEGLLKAYFSEFQGVNNVKLILKTYKLSRLHNNREIITQEIQNIRKGLNFKNIPKVDLISGIVSDEDIRKIHEHSHCFVLPHAGEGWGLPHIEAMIYGNPVIATNYSGNTDFMKKDNSYLLDYQLEPVSDMAWLARWYDGSMKWANADVSQLMKQMRYVYENQKEAKETGLRGRSFVLENFNLDTSAKMLIDAAKDLLGE